MFIPDLLGFELSFVLCVVDFFKDIFESAIILLQDSVLSGEIQRIISLESEFEAAVSKSFNTLISVVHAETNSTVSFELVDFHLFFSSVISLKDDLKSSRFVDCEISGFILVSEGVSANDDGLLPSWDQLRDIFDHDGFSEDSAVEDISDGSVGALPHLLEFEFLDSGIIGGDGGALDAYFALLDGFCGFNGDFVVGGVSVFHAEVEVEYV